MQIDAAKIETQLRELQRNYIAGLPGRLDEIESQWRLLNAGKWDSDLLSELHRRVHSLTGSGKTFGLGRLSDNARVIEHEIQRLMQGAARPDKGLAERLSRLLAGLRETLGEAETVQELMPLAMPSSHKKDTNDNNPVYVFEDDGVLASELSVHLHHFGYRTQTFDRLEDIERAVACKTPVVVIVDIMTDEGPQHGIQVASRIKSLGAGNVPVVFMSARDDFEARLGAVRAGGDAYIVKPADIPSLVDRLDGLTRRGDDAPYRILIADDDEALAGHYALVLKRAGMDVTTVARPEDVVNELVESSAELIVMDLYMPRCSGYDLAKVIRQQEAFVGIPIIFLSTETDADSQLLAMRMGGDDFLTKPIGEKELIAGISVRARRARVLGELMMYDSLTGLLKHARIREALDIEVTRARRRDAFVTYAMIDIDNFKNINDTYGHMMGDSVIKSLARLLKKRLRQGDSIGRYGGEEFAVVMTDCNQSTALQILDAIRESFSRISFVQGENKFSVTFSAGIAGFPGRNDANAVCYAADRALYRAKEQGRNRLVPDDDTAA